MAAVISAACLATAGCGSSDDDASTTAAAAGTTAAPAATTPGDKPAKIAYFTAALQNPYTTAAVEGIKEVAAQRNASVDIFDANFDAKKQGTQIQDAITSGDFDGFVILPVDGTIVPQVKEALDAGIAVASHNLPLGPDSGPEVQVPGVLASVMSPIQADAQLQGDETVAACEGKDPCNVAIMGGVAALVLDKAKMDGLDAIFKEHPNIKVVGTGEGEYLKAGGLKAMQDLLQANPDIDVLVVNGDQMALGAEQAIKAAGRTDEIQIISSGGTKSGVERVQDGRWLATTTNLPKSEGEITTGIVLDQVNGKTVQAGQAIDPATKSTIGPLITKETLAEDPSFVAEWDS
jgi:ribose transport system substrate-binding protein